jgi:predicted RNA-binding protein with EMAP domain
LETQISQLEFDIEQEKQHCYSYLTVESIVNYFKSIICGDTENIKVRKAIVNTFIREIIYYNNKIEIVYNFSDHYNKLNIKTESMEIIEKQSEITSTAKHNNISSYKITGSAPILV